MSGQLTDTIIMIRPKSFAYNVETAKDNKFQNQVENKDEESIQIEAQREFDNMVSKLRDHQIEVLVFEDLETKSLPDSVFPNNWISTHQEGLVFTYPMYAPIRRLERREDIIERLAQKYQISKRYQLEIYETQNYFLEGTGSLILDRVHKIAYACTSPRTNREVLQEFSILSGYQHILFKATDRNGFEIYHTNVLMSVGKDFVLCCMDAIDQYDKTNLLESFKRTNKLLIDLSFDQMECFAGNMLEVHNKHGKRYLICSATAFKSLTSNQIQSLEKITNFLVVDIPMIEKVGGGSARCMIAENFLQLK